MAQPASEIKPYDEIITKDAVSKPGLFLTHQVGDKLYYEIVPGRFGKDMLWVTQIDQTQAGFSYAGHAGRRSSGALGVA